MARYNTPVRDWDVKMPKGLRTPGRRGLKAIMTLQQGVTQFSKKKKNGCRLVSTREMNAGLEATTRKHKVFGCAAAFPKIKL